MKIATSTIHEIAVAGPVARVAAAVGRSPDAGVAAAVGRSPDAGEAAAVGRRPDAARPAALLVLRDEDGRIGLGEAAPLAGFSSETLSESFAALNAFQSPANVDESAPPLEAIALTLAPHAALLDAAPSARFAIETALLDLLAQRRGIDIASSLRAPAPLTAPSRAPASQISIETSALLTIPHDPQTLVASARAAVARGFRTIKVKLRATDGDSLQREIDALLALRRALPDVTLRLDPNGRWSIDEARLFLARLACVAPSFVEQPVSPRDLADLGPCAAPWAADESLGIPSIAARLDRSAGCVAFVLKPAALGIARALEAARAARERGLDVVVTHFLDGPIGLAAACELALGLDPPPLPCGLDPHPGLANLPPSLLPHHDRPGSEPRDDRSPPDSLHPDRSAPGIVGGAPRIAPTSRAGLGFSPEAIASLLAIARPVSAP